MSIPAPTARFTRRSSLTLIVASALLPGIALAQPAAGTRTVTDVRGTVTVPAHPRRVVVLDLAVLDIMQALELPVAAVPRAGMPPYLQSYANARQYPVAGTLFEPDFEALSRINPDLILVAGRSAQRHEVLSRIAPTLDLSVRSTHLLDDMQRNVTTLASLWGKDQMGEQLMQLVRKEVDLVKPLAAEAGNGLLVMSLNERLVAQAPGSRFGLLYDVFGIKPAPGAELERPRGQAFTMEDIAHMDPDWIYVIDRNTATGSAPGGGDIIPAEKVFDNDTIRNSRAGRENHVVFLDPKGWYLLGSAGPLATINNARQIRAVLEKDREQNKG